MLDASLCLEARGSIVRVPVRVVSGSVRRARVTGLDEVSVDWRARVTLLLEDEAGTIEVPAVVDWIGPTSDLRLLCPRARHLARLMRLMRSRFDVGREPPTTPERPSALRRAASWKRG